MFLRKLLLGGLASFPFVRGDSSFPPSELAKIKSLQSSTSATGSDCACNILTKLFEDRLHQSGSEVYTAESTHYWNSRGTLLPRCVFIPMSADEVAQAVVTLGLCKSQFAVRGGGHMPVPGAANTDGGVLIAMSSFKEVKVAEDEQSVDAGAGLDWHELYSAIEPHGLIVVGGRLKTIGIAGLTLGGGISYLTSKYGFAMDNVLAYEVVTASGVIITASATSDLDLFWALKGGGNNFGIVTKFTFAAYKAPKVSTGLAFHTEADVDQYITALANFANHHEEIDSGAGGIFVLLVVPQKSESQPLQQGVTVMVRTVQIGEVEKPAVFENFTALPNVFSQYAVSSLAEFVEPLDSAYQAGSEIFGTHSMLVDEAAIRRMWKTFLAATEKMKHIPDFCTAFTFQPISQSAAKVAKTNGVGNTWDIDDSKPYLWWIISTHWANSSNDDEVIAWQTNIREELHAANVEAGVALDFVYMNDAADDQDPFAGLPSANLERLKKIRAQYDPDLVFTDLVGGFKLDGKSGSTAWKKDEL
ncbi:FAD binding domain protein [Cadophora sp. DSE1049]|nr:FAD binding domain protein [Cadophora sp. DSE1049]